MKNEQAFPSPCGVLMILIEHGFLLKEILAMFPSPCGVLMILIITQSRAYRKP